VSTVRSLRSLQSIHYTKLETKKYKNKIHIWYQINHNFHIMYLWFSRISTTKKTDEIKWFGHYTNFDFTHWFWNEMLNEQMLFWRPHSFEHLVY